MFIVFNRQKIYSYLVALSTVVVLFFIAFAVTNQSTNTLQTSTNTEVNSNMNSNKLNNTVIEQNNVTKTN